jgi:hypothetical protein
VLSPFHGTTPDCSTEFAAARVAQASVSNLEGMCGSC